MKATISFIKQKFEEFNRQMFGGRLPDLPVELSDASRFLGMCVSKVTRYPDGREVHSDFRLRINTRIDFPQEVIEDTIIHEMIHYFILYNGLKDTSAHGAIFMAIMNSINATYSRHLTVKFSGTAEQHEQFVDTRRRWHIIAVVHFRSGKTGIKVLPRVVPKVIDYYNHVRRAAEVQEIDLFLHNDPFFNRYPTSASYRAHDIDAQTLAEHLTGAHRLSVDGSRLIQH